MASFSFNEIKKATNAELVSGKKTGVCFNVSIDSRTIKENDLFIALKGERFDGHDFVINACKKGASAVIISDSECLEKISEDCTVFLVKDTKKAFEDLAHFNRMRFDIPVVAVTGSNGKTTTKDMISALLSSKFNVCSTEKNNNNEIGLSLTLLNITKEHDACVVEMGMRGFGQIKELCNIAKPTIGVITNVGTSHIGILGSKENIAKAKGELIQSLPENGIAVLNGDDSFVKKMGENFKGRVIYYGLNGNYTVYGEKVSFENFGTKYTCVCFDEAFKVNLKLLGIHNVYDALAATSTARILGVDVTKIQRVLSDFSPRAGRQSLIEINGIKIIDDAYNANPLSMEMALRSLKQISAKNKYLVLADMKELGKNEEKFHYEIGLKAADMGFCGIITVGDLAKFIAKGAKEKGMKMIYSFDTCKEAAECILNIAKAGDVFLLKGSHSMQMYTIPDLLKEELEE